MNYRFPSILLLLGWGYLGHAQNGPANDPHKIVIETDLTSDFKKVIKEVNKDSIVLESTPLDYIELSPNFNSDKEKIVNDKVRWTLFSDKPLLIRSSVLGKQGKIVIPGDSIFISYNGKERNCSGKGGESMNLQNDLEQVQRTRFIPPTKSYKHISSVTDYFKWKKYLDEQLELVLSLIDSYQSKVAPSVLEQIKNLAIKNIEVKRIESFHSLYYLVYKNVGLTRSDLVAISDSTLDRKWEVWLKTNAYCTDGDMWYFIKWNYLEILKESNYDYTNNNIDSKAKRGVLYYNSALRNYTGLLRERLLQYVLVEYVIKEIGVNHPSTIALLKDYYKQPDFTRYKQWMKDFEIKANVLYNNSGSDAENVIPDFQLIDATGNVFKKSDLKGKIALLDFWFTGCTGCKQLVPDLSKVEDAFKGDSNVVFVSISIDDDKSKWLKSIEQKKYTIGAGINLYTGGEGGNHSIIKELNISSYPKLYLLNGSGNIELSVPDPRKDNGVALVDLIKKKKAELNDGPYVFYKTDSVFINSIYSDNGLPALKSEKKDIKDKGSTILKVSTDLYPEKFPVHLKRRLNNEPSIFEQPEKQLVLSDIEGNFDALRKLMKANGVIDNNYNWIFGDGHLIFVGDMFDRGEQVTECLWLIYSLEDQAKKAGGYIHYILGNHEILNMSNDQRYVRDKYKQNAKLLKLKYADLYSENSELGRWLRTKNIMEKVGDALYIHAGVAREINELSLSIQEINNLIRPYYANRDDFKTNMKTPELRMLFNSNISPFWYRGYYQRENQATIIDSTLQKFAINHIITGHTIVADTVSVHYDGKVINVDTHHAEGKSEALLIVGKKYYRVDGDGKKELIIQYPENVFVINKQ